VTLLIVMVLWVGISVPVALTLGWAVRTNTTTPTHVVRQSPRKHLLDV